MWLQFTLSPRRFPTLDSQLQLFFREKQVLIPFYQTLRYYANTAAVSINWREKQKDCWELKFGSKLRKFFGTLNFGIWELPFYLQISSQFVKIAFLGKFAFCLDCFVYLMITRFFWENCSLEKDFANDRN